MRVWGQVNRRSVLAIIGDFRKLQQLLALLLMSLPQHKSDLLESRRLASPGLPSNLSFEILSLQVSGSELGAHMPFGHLRLKSGADGVLKS